MTGFPSIDLSLFDIGAPWRDQVAAQVDSAASSFGAFLLVGHGVDGGLTDTLLELGGKYVKRGSGSDLPGFHDSVREYATSLTGLGHKLMAAMARGLRLDDGFLPITTPAIREFRCAWVTILWRSVLAANLTLTRRATAAC